MTILPRGQTLGVTHSLQEREKYGRSKDEMLADIMVALGGRVAEELALNTLTTGALSDFKSATGLARAMVCYYGMSDKLGPVVYSQEYEFRPPYSEETARIIDEEVRRIMDESMTKVRALLTEHRDMLDKLSYALLEKETMQAGEIYALLGIEPRTEFKIT